MFGCCTFSSESVCTKKKIKPAGLPRYQVIVDNEVQVPAQRSSSFSGPNSDKLKKVNQIQRWKYEGGRFISRHTSLVMEANAERTGVILWSRRPINSQSQQWLFINGCIEHEQTGLVLEATEDGNVRLAEKKCCSDPKVALSSSPNSLPNSFACYEDLPKGPITPSSIEESILIDPSQKWRLSSKGYLVNKATKKVLSPGDSKMGGKLVLKEKGLMHRTRASSMLK